MSLFLVKSGSDQKGFEFYRSGFLAFVTPVLVAIIFVDASACQYGIDPAPVSPDLLAIIRFDRCQRDKGSAAVSLLVLEAFQSLFVDDFYFPVTDFHDAHRGQINKTPA